MGKYNERKFEIFDFISKNGGTVEYEKLKKEFPNKFRSIYIYRRWKYLKIHKIGNSKIKYVTLYEKGKRTLKKMYFLKKEGYTLNIRKEFI